MPLKASEIAPCPDCGDAHLGRCGGLSYRNRLRSVRLDTSAVETRTKKRYWDGESLDEVFGEDRVERYMDDTKGRGHRTREEIATMSEEELEFYLGADTEHDEQDPHATL